jgi:hypothetical protein
MKYISPSKINLFFSCPLRWRYEDLEYRGIYIDDSHTRLGKIFHNLIIKDYFTHISDKPNPKEIENRAKESYKTGFVDESLNFMKKKSENILQNFIEFEKMRASKWRKYKPDLPPETKFKSKTGLFEGILDFYCDGTIIDWKTYDIDMIDESMLRQGSIYKLLLEDNGYRVDKVLFVMLGSGRVLEMPRVSRGWIENEGRKMLDMIEVGRFPKRPSGLCSYCPYILRCQMEGRCLWM